VADETGRPISGAEVDAESVGDSAVGKGVRLALTDASGAFIFHPLKFGTYKLYGLKPEAGFPDTKFEIYVENYHKAVATVSATSPNVFVTVVVGPKAGFVRLRVLDKNTRQSIANPTITLRRLDTGVWVSPGQDSDVPILVPPSIPTQLTVEAKGYVTWSNYDSNKANADALLKVKSGDEIQLTVELEGAH
jgi:hypothetical protein